LLHWQRRCREDKDEAGRFRLAQETNAYAVLPSSQWRGYIEPKPAPLEPWQLGAVPPLPDPITQAVEELRRGEQRAALAVLESDPGNALAVALARLGRAMLGPQSPSDLLECMGCQEPVPEVKI
jgi:hypothetical protein